MSRKRLNYGELIAEGEVELKALLGRFSQTLLKRRLRFLLLLKATPSLDCAAAGLRLGLGPRGARKMWDLYRKQGLSKYLDYPYKGRKPKLQEEQRKWLLQKASAEELTTLADTVRLLKEACQVPYSLSAVHYIFKALKIKKRPGRPSHIHKDEVKLQDFKKKASPA